MRYTYGVNIVTDKDPDNEQWIVSAVEISPEHKARHDDPSILVKYKTPLGTGNSIEEAYSSAIRQLLDGARNARACARSHESKVHGYLGKYERIEVSREEETR